VNFRKSGTCFFEMKICSILALFIQELLMFSLFDSAEIIVLEQTNGKTPPHKNADIEFSHHEIGLLLSSAYLRENLSFSFMSGNMGDF